jgi:hypothetical protein
MQNSIIGSSSSMNEKEVNVKQVEEEFLLIVLMTKKS